MRSTRDPITPLHLENLIAGLDVDLVRLSECLIDTGWQLDLGGADIPGIHYNIAGSGQMIVAGGPPIQLEPHMLVVLPPRMPFRVQVKDPAGGARPLNVFDGSRERAPPGAICRYVAGHGQAALTMICGHFRPVYGAMIDLFSALSAPIVERFGAEDRLGDKLRMALDELLAQEAGAGAMSMALLKQVLVALIRRSLVSVDLWVERFAVLSDPQVARALAAMAAKPGAPHTIESLADTAGLSRSAFMARFTHLLGRAPMALLRDLRMRRAAVLLLSNRRTVDQVAHDVGYASKSSFLRAFRDAHGCTPADYRAALDAPA